MATVTSADVKQKAQLLMAKTVLIDENAFPSREVVDQLITQAANELDYGQCHISLINHCNIIFFRTENAKRIQ
jgi:hypothetical protein